MSLYHILIIEINIYQLRLLKKLSKMYSFYNELTIPPLKRGWCHEFCQIFKRTCPLCTLSIMWHKCSCTDKKRTYALNIEAVCKNSMCTKFKIFGRYSDRRAFL